MNPYLVLRDRLGLSAQSGTSQNFHWLYLLLSALGAMEEANPTASLYSDPAKEVLHRLRAHQGFAAQELAKLIGA